MSDLVLRSRILHFLDLPDEQGRNVEYLKDGILVVTGGTIELCMDTEQAQRDGFDVSRCEHLPDHLVMPGFIDTHVHSPQIDVIASYGAQLLDWLENYTFPAELRFRDEEYAKRAAEDFLDYSLAAGTTTSFVFTTSFRQSTEALFEAALGRGLRMVAGKVLMDQHALAGLLDTAEGGYRDSRDLIEAWHGRGRLGYAVTPRFSGTCSPQQLALTGRLLEEYPDVWLQTHLSENTGEIAWLKSIYPEARDYLATYEKDGLNTDRSVFAHCIHLSGDEMRRLADGGGRVAFCPTSNLFLGSGLMPIEKLKEAGIPVSIASDVGGGTSLSMLKTLAGAYQVCQLQGYSLHPFEAFYMLTLGNARAVHLDRYVGNFTKGKEADLVILDPSVDALIHRRVEQSDDIASELFVYMMLGDERIVARTLSHGVVQYRNGA